MTTLPQTKTIGALILVGAAGFIIGQYLKEPVVKEVEVVRYETKVEVKEVIKLVEVEKKKTQHTEITKPDGTKIVTTTQTEEGRKEATKEDTQSKVEIAEKTVTKETAKDKYYLGLSVDLQQTYSIIGGVRLGDLPLYATGQIAVYPFNKAGVGLGLSYHF